MRELGYFAGKTNFRTFFKKPSWQHMRNRIIKICSIIVLPAVISFFYYRKAALFYSENKVFQEKMAYLYDSAARNDVLLLGSSRMYRHVDPRVIDSICHVDSYNFGMEGLNIAELRMMLYVGIEKSKAPRTLVMNVDPSSFEVNTPYYGFTDLLSYAARDTMIYRVMASVQDVYRHKWKYPFYRMQKYTAINDGFKVDALLEGTEKYRRRVQTLHADTCAPIDYKGYSPECDGYHELFVLPFSEPCQGEAFGLLRDIIHVCKEHGVRLVLVTAPMYKDYSQIFLNADSILNKVSTVAREENTPYFNMIRDSLSMDKSNFSNLVHLGRRGAALYSIQLARILNRLPDTGKGQ
jgi:hypothetical protein